MKAIKYISFNEKNGYGIAASRCMQGLVESGLAVSWTPLAPGKGTEPGLWYGPCREVSRTSTLLDDLCLRPVDYDVVICHTVPEYFPFWRQQERGAFFVGYTAWETDRLPRHWPDLLNTVDLLLVPCEWNRDVMRRCGVSVPIAVVPHVSQAIEPTGEALALAASPADTIFYTINAWTWRKALAQTIEAYLQAFSGRDNTLLVVKTGRDDLTRKRVLGFRFSTAAAIRKIRKKYRDPARIQLISDELSEGQMHSLHRQGHCFVSLTHGEGWGLGAFDAARAGNHVVITGYGGQLDFLPPELAALVEFERAPVHDPCADSYDGTQHWARASMADAVEKIRAAHSSPRPSGGLQDYIQQRFNSRAVTRTLLTELARHV